MPPTDDESSWLRLLAAHAAEGHRAVRAGDDWWSGRELLERAAGAAAWLDRCDAPAGRPVAALLTSSPESIALAVGGAASQRPLAPLAARATPDEVTVCLDTLDASLLVGESSTADLARAVAQQTGMPVSIIDGFEPDTRPLQFDTAPDAPAYILHTSGTTGRPKAVWCAHQRVAARIRLYRDLLELGPGTVYATASPFHHTAGLGLSLAALGNGGAVQPFPRFTVDGWDQIVRRGITHALLVPAMIEQLLRENRLAAGQLRALHYGAASINPATLPRLMAVLPDVEISQIFGQTEGSPITCLTNADHQRILAGDIHLCESQGRPPTGVDLVIAQPGRDGVGEVWARAAHLFKPDADGWLRTGDLGRVDREGYLYLCGRKDDMIVRGGENLYPDEVERVISRHPDVVEVVVFGYDDDVMGKRIAAVVVPRDRAAPPDPIELVRFTRDSLAGFKVPERWAFVDGLPRNGAGKVLRRVLAQSVAAGGLV